MLVSLVLLVLVAFAAGEQSDITLNYHETIGIPEAQRIRKAEQAMDFDGSRVGGGTVVASGAHPYLAGLLIELTTGQTSVCGASLLTNTRLLTAAHCWWDGRNHGRMVTAVLGAVRLFNGGTRVMSTNVLMHALFDPNNLYNDVAVIVTPWITYNNNIQPIALPDSSLQILNFAGFMGQLVGFGVTNDYESITTYQVARRLNVEIIRNEACAVAYGFKVIASTICTSGQGNVGPCGGDSGGPLSVTFSGRKIQVGVVSAYSAMGCRIGFPGLYARVTSFVSWIQARL